MSVIPDDLRSTTIGGTVEEDKDVMAQIYVQRAASSTDPDEILWLHRQAAECRGTSQPHPPGHHAPCEVG